MRRRTYTQENDANKLRCTFTYLWQEMTTSNIPMLHAKTRRKQERKRPKENERKVTANNENETNVCSGRRASPEWTRLLLAGTISFTLRPVDGPTEDRKKCRNEIKNGKRADTEPKLKIQARLTFCLEKIKYKFKIQLGQRRETGYFMLIKSHHLHARKGQTMFTRLPSH